MLELKDFTDQMLPAVETELQQVVAGNLPNQVSELREMLTYHLGWSGEGAGKEAQGKRIRPLLVLLSAAACGGDWRAALPAAAAVELIHNFSLLHDDIEDQSLLRHGRPTVWSQWGVAHAINAGDAMYTLAQLAVLRLPADRALPAARCLNQACLELTRGQYLDMSYETRCDLTLEDYWPMVAGKTAALLGGCTELGAIAAGADADRRAAFRQFGTRLGLAFQVLDDWLGIWGDAAVTGKSTDSDLVSGKKSLPVLYALAQNGRFARRWVQGPVTSAEARQVSAWMAQDGAETYTLETADRLTGEALRGLEQAIPVINPAALALRQLAELLLKRRH